MRGDRNIEVTETEKKKIIYAYTEGDNESGASLAKRFRRDAATIRKILVDAGVWGKDLRCK